MFVFQTEHLDFKYYCITNIFYFQNFLFFILAPSTLGQHLLNPTNPFYTPTVVQSSSTTSELRTGSPSNDTSETDSSDFHDTIDDDDLQETSEQCM